MLTEDAKVDSSSTRQLLPSSVNISAEYPALPDHDSMNNPSVYSYTQETHILIHILKKSSAFIVLGVTLTKCQQIHSVIPFAAHQMFTFLFTY